MYVWTGRNAVAHQIEAGEELGRRVSARLPAELGLGDTATLSLVKQGGEPSEFWTALKANRNEFLQASGT